VSRPPAFLRMTAILAAALALSAAALAQPGSGEAQPGWMQRTFYAGLKSLGLLFSDVGSLASGPAAGEIWLYDSRTGQRRRIGAGTGLSWPAPSPDGAAIYALRGRQAVRVANADGGESPLGAPADWRKLIGVVKDDWILGLVDDDPLPRPALLGRDGSRLDLPAPATSEERKRIGLLLQETRQYEDGVILEVRDSERGGRGRDVYLIQGGREKNLSDCGDDLCGQPARGPDKATFFFIRGGRP